MPDDRREPMWRRYLRFLRSDVAADVNDELEFHLAMRSRDYEAAGLSPDAARQAARERFGDVGRVSTWLTQHDRGRDRGRYAREVIGTFTQNVRVGLRALIKQPTFTATAVVTLALGIGATTAMFSVVYGVLLQPLPFGEPERLVRLWTAWTPTLGRGAVSAANARDWRAMNRVFEDIAILQSNRSFNFRRDDEPERLSGARVSSNIFGILRAAPLIGRTFVETENEIGRDNVVVLSHRLWVRHFGADPAIIGRTIALNGAQTTVVGVMKPDFSYPTPQIELWAPLAVPADEYLHRTWGSYSAIARLKPGVTLEQAQADLRRVSAELASRYVENARIEVGVAPLLDDLVGAVRQPLFILLGAVGVMLLIGCANLTNLLLARSLGRRRELAVRTALGASRGRLVGQSVAELVPLLALGGAAGLVTAAWLVRVLVPLLPADLPRVEEIGIHVPVLAFTTLIVALVGLLVTIWPAVDAARRGVTAGITELSRSATSAPRRTRARDALVIGQIATTLLLLVGATVLVRSFLALRQVSPGFDPDRVLSAHLAVPRTTHPLDGEVVTLLSTVVERVQALPGVVAVGMVNRLPLGGGNQTGGLEVEGIDPAVESPSVQTRSVSPDYFRALGIPVREGRSFLSSDDADAPAVAIVDEDLAKRLWPGRSALGHRIRESGDGPWSTVVGVVGHVRHLALDDEGEQQVYWNLPQRVQDRMAVVVKTRREPGALARSIATAVREVDPEQAIYDVRELEEVVDRSLGQRRFQMTLLGAFALIALVLASVGVYGVIAYGVGQRQREFGVRIALGARRRDVLVMVLRRGGWLFSAGALVGIALAAGTVRVLSTLVYAVAPHDVVSFAVSAAVLFVVSVAACWVPARRAAKVQPAIALRSE